MCSWVGVDPGMVSYDAMPCAVAVGLLKCGIGFPLSWLCGKGWGGVGAAASLLVGGVRYLCDCLCDLRVLGAGANLLLGEAESPVQTGW